MADNLNDVTTSARVSWWVPAAVGLGVVAVAAGGFAISSLQQDSPLAASAARPEATRAATALLVHEGDAVAGTGGVIKAPGESPVLCEWAPSDDMAYPPGEEPPPQCSPQRVTLVGLDESTLPDWTERDGTWFTRGTVRVDGTWEGGALTVESVSVEEWTPYPDDYDFTVPCAAPEGGWKPYEGLPETIGPESYEQAMAALYTELEDHPDKYHSGWMSYPDGDPMAADAPKSDIGEPMPEHLVRVVTTVEDPVAVQAELAALFEGNLCVVQVDYSAADLAAAAARLAAQDETWFVEPHGDSKSNRLRLQVPVLDDAVIAKLGDDAPLVDVQPFLQPR